MKITATCNFVSLGDKMRELFVKKMEKKEKMTGKEKRKIKNGAKFSRCVAVFLGKAE